MRTKAWHLRQDGKAFPVEFHLYGMNDTDLSSEAEIASFLIATDSNDLELAKYVLDAWIALILEEELYNPDMSIDDGIKKYVHEYVEEIGFAYPLSVNDMISIHHELNNYHDLDTLYDFCEEVRDKRKELQKNITQSINQQFCRVRFGGRYDSDSGNNEIWFRISSVNFNWLNVIYEFVSDNKRKLGIEAISICRDAESDQAYTGQRNEDVFYRAKDGSSYHNMYVEEFLSEEHGKNPVFSSTNINRGILASVRGVMSNGFTYLEACSIVNVRPNIRPIKWIYFLNHEIQNNCN